MPRKRQTNRDGSLLKKTYDSCRLGLERFELSHQAGGFLDRVGVTGSAQPIKFDHIQAAFSQFQSANQASFAVEFRGQLSLR
jgi:hypothetical protein